MITIRDIVQYYAQYNLNANTRMIAIISDMIQDPINSPLKGYFLKALGTLLEHIYLTDLSWLKAFMELGNYGKDIEEDLGFALEPDKSLFQNFEDFTLKRQKLDMLIVEFTSKVEEEFFSKKLTIKNSEGEEAECEIWKAIIQFFNRQTHYRGQISNILDQLHIPNDFSNMILIS